MNNLFNILNRRANAFAEINGGEKYPNIRGTVSFYKLRDSVLVKAKILGLPDGNAKCESPVFGFHIHSGFDCSGTPQDPFSGSKTHYNPNDCLHPYHAGDMPPLFGANGTAFLIFITNRFTVEEIIGRTVIIHLNPDDFMTQPSGNSGEKIACGIIQK